MITTFGIKTAHEIEHRIPESLIDKTVRITAVDDGGTGTGFCPSGWNTANASFDDENLQSRGYGFVEAN